MKCTKYFLCLLVLVVLVSLIGCSSIRIRSKQDKELIVKAKVLAEAINTKYYFPDDPGKSVLKIKSEEIYSDSLEEFDSLITSGDFSSCAILENTLTGHNGVQINFALRRGDYQGEYYLSIIVGEGDNRLITTQGDRAGEVNTIDGLKYYIENDGLMDDLFDLLLTYELL